eukprot:CAMPEP_0196587550 /NCGR_PEP_ID=MMETSP1081-20130531/57751_1 /TAXON_ID=36882 /ORGANISM="Pyramimonas amylifera, Strain CCMP720" /LENGTH=226 /DNA_ID=CAMNT_0041909749 /DNA_START=85 /DNA_END=765 /DNA_ORIENTATION=+
MSIGKLRQNFNAAGIKIFIKTYWGNRHLALPHLEVEDIRSVNWKALKDAGFEGCVFDKDNTLTAPYAMRVHPPLQESLDECRHVFGDKLAILSNSAGLAQYDPQGAKAAKLEKELKIPVLRHESKKPAGTPEELQLHFGCSADRLVMVGDRYLTDIVYGNLNGMFTIHPAPFTTAGETSVVLAVRAGEDYLINRWRTKKGILPKDHPLILSPLCDYVLSQEIASKS